ncbi:MAG: LLM class F420-dependent oxidoreductase [Nocardioidaceae bacterium]
MRLGLNIGYVATDAGGEHVRLAQVAERAGYTSVWAAEAYGSDVVTLLTWIAAQTESIDIGTAIMQIPGRSPAMTAMTAATLDTLTKGRFRLGLGVSGPQVSEGWHGVRFAKPLARTREYVDVVKLALSRQTVRYDGEHFMLPLPDGPGKALKLMLHPYRQHIPIYLAVIGPKNLEQTGEIADGWLSIFFAPEHAEASLGPLRAGAERSGRTLADLDIVANVPVVVGDDLDACAEPLRGYTALYVGGMGSRQQNFYNALARRMGYDEAAEQIQTLYLDKRHREAMAAVPRDLIDQTALIGPKERIAERLHAYAEAGVTTINVTPFAADEAGRIETLRTVSDLVAAEGLGDSDAR